MPGIKESQEEAILADLKAQQERRDQARAMFEARNKGLDAPVDTSAQVTCRVLKKGADRISKGHHIPGLGEVYYEFNERFEASEAIARQLEALDYVEVLPEETKPAKA